MAGGRRSGPVLSKRGSDAPAPRRRTYEERLARRDVPTDLLLIAAVLAFAVAGIALAVRFSRPPAGGVPTGVAAIAGMTGLAAAAGAALRWRALGRAGRLPRGNPVTEGMLGTRGPGDPAPVVIPDPPPAKGVWIFGGIAVVAGLLAAYPEVLLRETWSLGVFRWRIGTVAVLGALGCINCIHDLLRRRR